MYTQRCLEKSTIFGISGYSDTLSHCSASIQSRLTILFLFRKLGMAVYVTDLLFSSENWTKEKHHLKLIVENKIVSFLSNLK